MCVISLRKQPSEYLCIVIELEHNLHNVQVEKCILIQDQKFIIEATLWASVNFPPQKSVSVWVSASKILHRQPKTVLVHICASEHCFKTDRHALTLSLKSYFKHNTNDEMKTFQNVRKRCTSSYDLLVHLYCVLHCTCLSPAYSKKRWNILYFRM